jgi:hypothetical protein
VPFSVVQLPFMFFVLYYCRLFHRLHRFFRVGLPPRVARPVCNFAGFPPRVARPV